MDHIILQILDIEGLGSGPQVAVVVEISHQVAILTHNQDVAPDVELPPVDQERVE